MLHARKISFSHPGTGKKIEARAPLPDDMERLLNYLRHRD
jgi:23S rRNA pseudouridine1911/1915/1917 synthase